jgi:adhesin transport system outer membrane protein
MMGDRTITAGGTVSVPVAGVAGTVTTGRHVACRSVLLAAAMLTATPAIARQTSALPQGSLVVDPQQGATPRPLPPSPSLPQSPSGPPATMPPAPPVVTPLAIDRSIPSRDISPMWSVPSQDSSRAPSAMPDRAGALPVPSGDPLAIDPANDPVLLLARTEAPMPVFRQAIAAAVARNPALDEGIAQVDEAEAARQEAKARALPVADLSISTFQVIDRAFSNDPNNVLERSRPRQRTDGLLRVQQPIVDFGASLARIRAGQARLDAARSMVEDTGTRLALQAVAAWYNVYGYRVLVRLGETFSDSQRALRGDIEQRIRQGAAAPADVAQVDSYIASSSAQLADFRRQLASAEAQYAAIVGASPSPGLARAPVPALGDINSARLADDTDRLPLVRAARLGVAAARADARALKSDRLPQVSAGIDAGRYGIIETARDYDIRGSVTLSLRLGGGAAQRVDQAEARAEGADARLRRTRIEAQRDAEIALADVTALQEAQAAIESNYVASRRSRDLLAERFRVSRGTLFDLLAANSNYFGVATRFVQTMIELDIARYAFLARTGRLLPVLDIRSATLEPR